MKGQDHFFQIAKVSEFRPVGNSANKNAIFLVIKKYCGVLCEPVENITRSSINKESIWFLFQVFIIGKLKEVTHRESKFKKLEMEINHNKQLTNFCRVANPLAGCHLNQIERILLYKFKVARPFIHRLLYNQWRIDQHLPDYRYRIELIIFFNAICNLFR